MMYMNKLKQMTVEKWIVTVLTTFVLSFFIFWVDNLTHWINGEFTLNYMRSWSSWVILLACFFLTLYVVMMGDKAEHQIESEEGIYKRKIKKPVKILFFVLVFALSIIKKFEFDWSYFQAALYVISMYTPGWSIRLLTWLMKKIPNYKTSS